MIFRPTQRLQKKINAGPLAGAPLHENPYADWSARLFTADRAQYILLSNTASLYSTVMFGRGITDDNAFIRSALSQIREAMEDDGLTLIYANFIVPETERIQFCKAVNRSATGSMNDLEGVAKRYLLDGLPPFDTGFRLNETPMSALSAPGKETYATPREAIRHAGA